MFENSKLSSYRVAKIVECFCLDIDASKTGQLLRLNRKTVNRYFGTFRRLIQQYQMTEMAQFVGIVELDESFFGANRVRGRPGPRKRGRGTTKQPVFGIYERYGRIYTELVSDCSAYTLQKIIRGRVSPDSVILTDGWRGYDGLVDVGFDKHLRINKSKHFVSKGASTSTGSRPSGALLNDGWPSSTESRKTSNFTSKNANGGTTSRLRNYAGNFAK